MKTKDLHANLYPANGCSNLICLAEELCSREKEKKKHGWSGTIDNGRQWKKTQHCCVITNTRYLHSTTQQNLTCDLTLQVLRGDHTTQEGVKPSLLCLFFYYYFLCRARVLAPIVLQLIGLLLYEQEAEWEWSQFIMQHRLQAGRARSLKVKDIP